MVGLGSRKRDCCIENWRKQPLNEEDAQLLSLSSRGYRAITPDLHGYDDTDAPPSAASYSSLHIIDDLVSLLDSLGLEQVFLVAHDWGAVIAWYFCLFLLMTGMESRFWLTLVWCFVPDILPESQLSPCGLFLVMITIYADFSRILGVKLSDLFPDDSGILVHFLHQPHVLQVTIKGLAGVLASDTYEDIVIPMGREMGNDKTKKTWLPW